MVEQHNKGRKPMSQRSDFHRLPWDNDRRNYTMRQFHTHVVAVAIFVLGFMFGSYLT